MFDGYIRQLLLVRRPADALQMINSRLLIQPRDPRLYRLQAQAYAAMGNRLQHHRSLGEAYASSGEFGAAMEQMQIALKTGEGDFYQLSAVEARLRELRQLHAELGRKSQIPNK